MDARIELFVVTTLVVPVRLKRLKSFLQSYKATTEANKRLNYIVFMGLLSAFSMGAYLVASALTYRTGFPLDDAWIHQTYARNLALRGEWSFVPGIPSAGSTAPLWSGLLAVGHALRLGPFVWTYLLGWALLLALGIVGVWTFKALAPQRAGLGIWAGVLLIFEWHLVWSAASGMETLFFALCTLIALAWLAAGLERWLELGLLIGLSAWVRPDGITLLAPAMLLILIYSNSWKARKWAAGKLFAGFASLFIPYLLFNRFLAGAWWPNTFYAKQAEYAILRSEPIWVRLAAQIRPLMQGVGILLLPGFAYFLWESIRLRHTQARRAWGALAGAAWLVGYLLLYAWRLPVAYQHGRYLLPILPLYSLMGLAGMASWVDLSSARMGRRVIGRVWSISVGLILVLYWVFGARAYAGDVAFIETEMVACANWVADHTPGDSLVAAHDIGALGYFGRRPILDLAGLVSPEVIPFIRDESRLAVYLDEQRADYLVTFPDWYPQLVQRGRPLYQSGGLGPQTGGENMTVYGWK